MREQERKVKGSETNTSIFKICVLSDYDYDDYYDLNW